jgi:hypothetical protein
MSQIALTTHHNIRLLIDDLDRDTYAINPHRLSLIIRRKVQLLTARTFQPLVTPTTIALVAGTFDYTVTGTPNSIRQLILNSDGTPLERLPLPELNAIYKQDTLGAAGRGTPRHFAMYELNTQVNKIRVGPTPSAADTLDIYYDIYPASNVGNPDTASSDVPFGDIMLAALEKSVAAECVLAMDDADRKRRKLSREYAGALAAEAEALIAAENWRQRMYEAQETVDLVNPD